MEERGGGVSDAGWNALNRVTIGGFNPEGEQVRTHLVEYYAPDEDAAHELADIITLIVAQEMGGKPA